MNFGIIPPRHVVEAIAAEEREERRRVEMRSRCQAAIDEIDAKIGPGCHWCQSGLYDTPPGGCPQCGNGPTLERRSTAVVASVTRCLGCGAPKAPKAFCCPRPAPSSRADTRITGRRCLICRSPLSITDTWCRSCQEPPTRGAPVEHRSCEILEVR